VGSVDIPASIARQVRDRAGNVCEYCRLPQSMQEAAFHINHIHPRVAGGKTVPPNLALACVSCSLRKGARTQARDPRTQDCVPLFNPRLDNWTSHFGWTRTWRVRGKTKSGRATIAALAMNRIEVVRIRRALVLLDEFPIMVFPSH